MFQTIKHIFSSEDLRKRIIYTLMMIAVFRVGAHIPAPFVDGEQVASFFRRMLGGGRGVFSMVNMFTGGAFKQMTIMALGIMPYISAQIIFQLLTVVWPKLEKIKKEGEAGQRKLEQWTRYGTIGLAFFQSIGLGLFMLSQGFVSAELLDYGLWFFPGTFIFMLFCIVSITTGTAVLMWIGERITQNGVGNGISLLIALGIMASYPPGVVNGITAVRVEALAKIWVPVIIALGLLTTCVIILIQEGARKIPIQHARRTVGRRVQAAQTNYLPLKVNTAGVIPVIFSSAILMLPQTLFSFVGSEPGGMGGLAAWFSPITPYNLYDAMSLERESIFLLLKTVNLYTFLYVVITAFFCFFYTAVQMNPVDIADNLKRVGAYVPGIRPGKATADYIDMVLTRITTVGAIFLVGVALIPQILANAFEIPFGVAEFAGGTGLIIVVGVVLDTMKRVESHLLMHHYEGFSVRRSAAPGLGGGGKRWGGQRK